MEVNPNQERADTSEKERKQRAGKSRNRGAKVFEDSASDNEVFVSVKSISISGTGSGGGSRSDLLFKGHGEGGNNEKFSIPNITSETRVVVPRVCSDGHIGEGEGFHSSRLSSSASHGSLNSALLAVGVGISSSTSKSSPNSLKGNKENKKEGQRNKNAESDATVEVVKRKVDENDGSGGGKEKKNGNERNSRTVKSEQEEVDIDIDPDLSIQVEHDSSIGNTDDLLDEEILEEYDEPDDEFHRELGEKFGTDVHSSGESSRSKKVYSTSSGSKRKGKQKEKQQKFVDSSTWTQEDDMPSPVSDLSPVQSPKRKSSRNSRNKASSSSSSGGGGGGGGHSSSQQPFYQYQYYRELPSHKRHHNASASSSRKSHSKSSRGIHQSHSNQRPGGSSGSSVGEFIHHQPQQHHHHFHPPHHECYTISSELLSREARLYENVPATAGELEALEILLAEDGSNNYSNSGASNNTSKGSTSHSRSTTSNKNHHHSANNLNLGVGGGNSSGNSVEQLFSVSEFLGPGSCLAVGGGPPSRTSWVDSGRESLSFDGENNNSSGSTRNLLLIPPPPPPPLNFQGGFNSSNIMMQNTQSPAHHSSRRTGSRKDRLIRQKHAIDEPFLPIPTNSTDALGLDQGGTGGSYLVVPSPRRGMLQNSVIASNFAAAAASPISLQRHPIPSQLMLQENKKNKPLIACESPYGITSGGPGTGDWNFGSSDKKGQMPRELLRCRSPQRGWASKGKSSNNQSFDYGEIPSHQMFPKRHLLTSRQLSSHNHLTSMSGNNQPPNNNSGFILQPQHQHRSFPAGIINGMTPKSCSMGDLTSSNPSPNHLPRQNYQSFHGNGKNSEQIALCHSSTNPSTVPLVTSLPLPPQTSVTYEFSLAPQSGTLAPGWHLTAVQRGLATAVPLAAAVARRRLPRPRPTRPRFGFADKNEARRAKWTIAVTALALLAMSMLLVGITLRLAPLIDDLVRKENENLMRVIQQTSPSLNNLTTNSSSLPSTLSTQPTLLVEDGEESSDNYYKSNSNNNNLNGGGQSLTRSEIAVDPGPGPKLLEKDRSRIRNETMSGSNKTLTFTSTTTSTSTTTQFPKIDFDEDGDQDESGTVVMKHPQSLIARKLQSVGESMSIVQDDAASRNSETSIKEEGAEEEESEPNSVFTEQIISDSDIDENYRGRTSIVLR